MSDVMGWLKDHFEFGMFTPKPVGYCKRQVYGNECTACTIINLLAWFFQATVIVLTGFAILVFFLIVMLVPR